MRLLSGCVALCALVATTRAVTIDSAAPHDCVGSTAAVPDPQVAVCGAPTPATTILLQTGLADTFQVSAPGALFATGAPGAACPTGRQLDQRVLAEPTGSVTVTNWATIAREAEEINANVARPLCWSTNDGTNWFFSGFWVKTVSSCANDAACGAPRAALVTGLSPTARARVIGESRCCSGRPFPRTGIATQTYSQCINPNTASCCGSNTFTAPLQTCCGGTTAPTGIVSSLTGSCPCNRGNADTACPTGQTCCLPTKYPELNQAQDPGQCFNPATRQCCNTGSIYDPGQQQCCSINGLQSLDAPCPCGMDSDCAGGQTGNPLANMLCCRQVSPPPAEVQQCSIYSNYPTGTGPADRQRCLGKCINSQYQICCNGVACVSSYEKCCNATCCNKFDGTCTESFRAGARGVQANWVGFGQQFTQCTTVESMSIMKAFWAFIIPTTLLAIMFGGLALVLVFATRVTRKFNWVERGIIGTAILSILFGFPTFFAPVWKYGIVVVLVSLFAIVTAAARLKWLNIVCVILVVVELIYLYDPWNGNAYLTLALDRFETGAPNGDSAGILHSITRMYPNVRGDVTRLAYCTRFYDFFKNDPLLQDQDRRDNPLVVTFGYCSRAWTYALLMFSGVLLVASALLFFLTVIALVLRFKDDRGYDPIELEVRGQGSKVGSYYN